MKIKQRTQVIPTTLDFERVETGLKQYATDRVCIVYNKNPKAIHKKIAEEILEKTKEIVGKKFDIGDEKKVLLIPVDYYHFKDSLVSLYELFYREKLNDREIIVNVGGGTKPVAIATAFACSLAGIGAPIYFAAKKYKKESVATSEGVAEEIISKGVIEEPFPIEPLFELENILPTQKGEIQIIDTLLKNKNAPMNITQILITLGEIPAKLPPGKITSEKEEIKKDKQSKIPRYHRYAQNLEKKRIIEISRKKVKLTATGELIGRLLEKKTEIERELA